MSKLLARPFNNRLLIEECKKEENKVGGITIPESIQDKKRLEKFLQVKVLDISPDLKEGKFANLTGARVIVETGMIEEVIVGRDKFMFCPANYIVCVVDHITEQE